MPFTPTHVVAVLPLARRLPLAALAIGAMVPDWSLYFPFGPDYTTTHSLTGATLICVPLGLAIVVLWYGLFKQPMFALLPRSWRERLGAPCRAPATRSVRALAVAAFAVWLGALTHVVWDAFTHVGRWGVGLVPVLDDAWFHLGDYAVRGYSVLQHGSSVIGLPLLAFLAWRWLRRATPAATPPSPVPPVWRVVSWLLLVVVPLAYLIEAAIRSTRPLLTPTGIGRLGYITVTAGGATLAILFVVYAIGYRLWRGRQDTDPSVRAMWRDYAQARKLDDDYSSFYFGNSEELASELAALVVAGTKRATATSVLELELRGDAMPRVGDHAVVTDWHGRARCIVRTTAVDIRPYRDVDAGFAAHEGEGDGSLEHWRRVHWDYYTAVLAPWGRAPHADMQIVCERFEVVYPGGA